MHAWCAWPPQAAWPHAYFTKLDWRHAPGQCGALPSPAVRVPELIGELERFIHAPSRLHELLRKVLKTSFPTANNAIQILIRAGFSLKSRALAKNAPSAMKLTYNAYLVSHPLQCCAA